MKLTTFTVTLALVASVWAHHGSHGDDAADEEHSHGDNTTASASDDHSHSHSHSATASISASASAAISSAVTADAAQSSSAGSLPYAAVAGTGALTGILAAVAAYAL